MNRDRTLHYVTYDRLPAWLDCGWLIWMPNGPMHHHFYGVVVEWLCDCRMPRPQ